MSLNQLALNVLNEVQDKGHFSLHQSVEKFGRSESTIKRTVQQLNEYLPLKKKLVIKEHTVYSQLTYDEKIDIIQSLSFDNYQVDQDERLELLIFTSFFNGSINMTELYRKIGMSDTTRKKDRQEVEHFFGENSVCVESVRGKGIEIFAQESVVRMFVAHKLATLLEFNSQDSFEIRAANNPVEMEMCRLFIKHTKESLEVVKKTIVAFFKHTNLRADYASKKLFQIYYRISLFRKHHDKKMTAGEIPQVLSANVYTFFDTPEENKYMNLVISSLNYNRPLVFPQEDSYVKYTKELIAEVKGILVNDFVTYDELFFDVYSYIYKSLIKNELGYVFYDDKVENIAIEYPHILNVITDYQAKHQLIELKDTQIATLSLIFSTYTLRNKVYKKEKKKIVIITNSSSEKVLFFVEELKKYIDFELSDYLTLNELYLLEELAYDALITFSTRITDILNKGGYHPIHMPFYLKEEHAMRLYAEGFSTNYQRKLLADEFIKEFKMNKSDKEKLVKLYPDYFI